MRLFVAIPLSEDMKKTVTGTMHDLKQKGVRGNYVPARNLHLTLAFLGETDSPGAVKEALSALSFRPFRLSFSDMGTFDDLLWVGIKGNQGLKSLAKEVRAQLNQKSIRYTWHAADVSVLEGVLARGDRRLADAIEHAYRHGALFDAWTEFFDRERWTEAFAACGLDPYFYTARERSTDELLPWDFLDCGVTKQYLWREKEKSERAETTKDCRMGCNGCGIQRLEGVCSWVKNPPLKAGDRQNALYG